MTSPLLWLSAQDLREIAAALESGRLTRLTPLHLGRWSASAARDALAKSFRELTESGLTGAPLVALLRLLAEQREMLEGDRPRLELVWTGPKTTGSASRDTATVARQLFQRATRSVLVSTFAIYEGKTVFAFLAKRMDEVPDLDVRIFLNVPRPPHDVHACEEDLVQAFAEKFRTKHWPARRLPAVFYDPRSLELDREVKAVLHAKCIVIDDAESFVSSANFTEAAHERNIEAGVLVHQASVAMALRRQFDTLVAAKLLLPVPGLA